MSYRIVAPLVIARQSSGANVHLYAGAPVPDSVGKDELKRLEEGGYIESVGGQQAAPAKPEGDKAPAKSAGKSEWEDYARSRGASDEDLDGLTKDELVAKYGDK